MTRVPLIDPETGETVLASRKGAPVLIERGYEAPEGVEVEPVEEPETPETPEPETPETEGDEAPETEGDETPEE